MDAGMILLALLIEDLEAILWTSEMMPCERTVMLLMESAASIRSRYLSLEQNIEIEKEITKCLLVILI